MALPSHVGSEAPGPVTPKSDDAQATGVALGIKDQNTPASGDFATDSRSSLSTGQMLAELRCLCPRIWTRPLTEFGQGYAAGIWTGADGAHVMPDGLPMFCSMANGSDGYNGPIHSGFEAWLAARGWWVENFDGATFFLLPESQA